MIGRYLVLVVILFIITAGCTTPAPDAGTTIIPTPTDMQPAPLSVSKTTQPPTTLPRPVTTDTTLAITVSQSPTMTTSITTTPTPLSDAALNARIVSAKIQLTNLKDSDMAGTILIQRTVNQECEVKKSRELGYLIDTQTGDSFFVTGDYWSISANLFEKNMKKDRDYIIIHTHPKSWIICGNTGTISLNTFSLGDLEAAAAMNDAGYHIRELIAISDMDYVIYPKIRDDWRSQQEIIDGVAKIETRYETKFSTYYKDLDTTFYDVDNLMPLLARQLNYTYTANQNVLA